MTDAMLTQTHAVRFSPAAFTLWDLWLGCAWGLCYLVFCIAGGETAILLHPPLPSVGVSIVIERGVPEN